jgi:hypothetical protein
MTLILAALLVFAAVIAALLADIAVRLRRENRRNEEELRSLFAEARLETDARQHRLRIVKPEDDDNAGSA